MYRIILCFCLLTTVSFSPIAWGVETDNLAVTTLDSNDVLAVDAEPQPFLLSDIEALETSVDSLPSADEQVDAIHIAEPGTLGLLALAGLMGGAVAMRRRLG